MRCEVAHSETHTRNGLVVTGKLPTILRILNVLR